MQQQQHLLKLQGCSYMTWVWSDRFLVFLMSYKRSFWTIQEELSWLTKGQQLAKLHSELECRQLLEIARHCLEVSCTHNLPATAWGQSTHHCASVRLCAFQILSWLSSHYLFLYLFTVSYFTPSQWCSAQLSFVLLPSYPQHQVPPASSS